MGVWDPDDPGFKQWTKSSGGGGGVTVGGGGGGGNPPGVFGLGGGGIGLPGTPSPTLTDTLGSLRSLVRRRAMPSEPSYLTTAPPVETPPPPSTTGTSQGGRPGLPAAPDLSGIMNNPFLGGRLGGVLQRPGVINWKQDPADNRLSNGPQGVLDVISEILQQMRLAGLFDPTAPRGIIDSVRSRAREDASAAADHSRLLAQSLGTDPASAASYALQADLRGQGDVSKAVNSASTQAQLAQMGFSQDLLRAFMEIMAGARARETSKGQQQTDWAGIGQSAAGIGQSAAGILGTVAKLGW